MDTRVFKQIYNQQKGYFNSQATKSYDQRVKVLNDLKAQILKYEITHHPAMQADMAKPEHGSSRGRDMVRGGRN